MCNTALFFACLAGISIIGNIIQYNRKKSKPKQIEKIEESMREDFDRIIIDFNID